MNITISASALKRANNALRHISGAFPRAVANATNRTLEGLRTDAVSETKGRYFVKSGDVRKTLTLKRAGAGNMAGAVVSRGSRKNLAEYKLFPTAPRKGRMASLKGAVKRDGLKSLGNAFLVRRGGKYRPYTRTGTGRWNIEPFISPAIPQIIKNEETVKAMEKGAEERFSKRLDHEVMRLLGVLP